MSKDKSKLLSVVVPIYKVEDYIEKCLDSLLSQTYKNLEIILVDDGSPDKCGDICDDYQKKDDRIKVIHQKNMGLSGARNSGIKKASGDYIAFLDSDDYIHPRMYEILMNEMEKKDVDVIICDYDEVQEGSDVAEPSIDNITSTIIGNEEAHNGYYVFEKKARFVVAWNKIYKKSLFKDIEYPVGKIHEDTFTTYKLLYKAKQIAYIDLPLYHYLIRGNSIMGEGFSEKRLLILDAIQEEIQFFESNEEPYAMGLAYLDYRDYMIDFNKKVKSSKDIDKKILNSYKRFLRQYLFKMSYMQIPFKKQLKTFAYTYFLMGRY